MFDADAIMNATMTDPMSTAVLVCPEGEFRAIVDDGDKAIALKEWPGQDGKDDSHQATILFSILDDAVKAYMKRDKVLVPMNAWLDLNAAKNGLDFSEGKNVSLGRLRKALNQNEPGQAWNFAMLKGKGPLMVKVQHRADKKDPTIKYAEITRIAQIS